MAKLVVGLLVALCIGLAVGKFTNLNVLVLESYDAVGSFTFFWGNYIVIGADVAGGFTLGKKSSISIYTAQRVLVNKWELPYPCSSLPCSTGTTFVALAGSVVTLLNRSPYQFVSVNLTNGAVVATGTPPKGDSAAFEYLKVNDNLVLISYQNYTVDKNFYSYLTLSNLSSTAYQTSPYYRTWLYSSFAVDPAAGKTYLCAVNPTTKAFVYKAVTFKNNKYNVTNSSIGISCGGNPTYAAYSASQQQLLLTNVVVNTNLPPTVIFVSTAGGKMQIVGNTTILSTNASPAGLADFANGDTTSILPFRFLNNQTYGYLQQFSTQPGSVVIKDIVQIPQPFFVASAGYDNDGIVNNNIKVYVSSFLYCDNWSTSGFSCPPGVLVAEFDDN